MGQPTMNLAKCYDENVRGPPVDCLIAQRGSDGQHQKLLSNELQTRVQARFPLEDILPAIELYTRQRTEGKIQLLPQDEN